jgi:pilus assembly protein CpaC
MRTTAIKACGLAMLGLAGGLTAVSLPGIPSQAVAGPRLDNAHHSVLRITDHEAFPIHRTIRLGRNKSMMIELPRDVRDVMVSDPKVMDAIVQSSSRVFLVGKNTAGQTNVFFFDSNGERMMTLEISVETDATSLEDIYRRLIPSSRIKVEVMRDTLILTGSVQNAGDATRAQQLAQRFALNPNEQADTGAVMPIKVINMLSVMGKEQVMLRVTVAEVNRTLSKQLGINVGAAINSGNLTTTLLTNNALPVTGQTLSGSVPSLASSAAGLVLGQGTNSGATGMWTGGQFQGAYGLRAMERDGLLRTLAEPNMTAISGETARFLAGGEFPVPLVDSLGQVSVSFKKFGVGLAFTPMVAAEDRITLKIETEVSELDQSNGISIGTYGIPGLKTRQATTTVDLPSGGALAIAGLLSEDTRQNIDGVPGLKDVPVLGTLFRSRDYLKKETELVVIVAPVVVKSVDRNQLALPTDGLVPASDRKANFLGHLNRIYGRGDERRPEGRYDGDYGFIIE